MISLGLVNFAKRMVPIGRQDGCKQEEWLMLRRFFQRNAVIAATFAGAIAATPAAAGGGGVIGGGATEWTQLLNNSELIAVVGKSTEQINNQITQITQLAQQIQNQLRIYENMLQNTAQLPQHIWGQVERDLNQLRNIVGQGQGIAFSMGNADDVLKQRFKSYADFKTNLPTGSTFSSTWQNWSTTNRDTSEEATMGELRSMSQTADGQMKALQVGHQIAAQQVAQTQKLRALFSQQVTMMGTWFQSQQAKDDLAQARRDQFFTSSSPSTSGGQTMEPRW
jgi:conjugal transfer/entry exclusion protein